MSDLAWFHVTFSTFGAWLPGDERGFRSHDHRIHSSGHYKDPPPLAEHRGLRRWVRENMHKPPVTLTFEQRHTAGESLLRKFSGRSIEVIALAVCGQHVHVLARLPLDGFEQEIGHAKRAASLALTREIPGALWGRRCQPKQIRDREHQKEAFGYITDHAHEGAWVWTFRDPLPT